MPIYSNYGSTICPTCDRDEWIVTSSTTGSTITANSGTYAIRWLPYSAATTSDTTTIPGWYETAVDAAIGTAATTLHEDWRRTDYIARTQYLFSAEAGWRVIRPEQIIVPRASEEERARWAERERRWREEEAQRKLQRKAAEGRAEKLLMALLTPEQREDYKNKRCFFLEVNGQQFRVDYGTTGNVKRLDPVTQEVTDSFCIHPSGRHGCPVQDVMVAQKLMLESDISKFMKTANHHSVRRYDDPGRDMPRAQLMVGHA